MKDNVATTMKAECCEQCDNYKFALRELRWQRILRFLEFASVLMFVAILVISLKSYIPCLFLFLLLLR